MEEQQSQQEYVKILRALLEIPFAVGKNLLVDFLRGDYKNKSISKNCLDELQSFGSSSLSKDEILECVDMLMREGMVEAVTSDYNRFVKVLKITLRGRNELSNPTLDPQNAVAEIAIRRSMVTPQDRAVFEELKGFLHQYNDDQKKAIISGASQVLCIAGAGSGKTTTLTKRVEFLIRYKGIPPQDILAITFTRKAREEMEKRLFDLGIQGVSIHTFNSFCEQILKKHEREIYGTKMRVQGYGDKVLAMNMALSHLGLTMNEMINEYFSLQQRKFKTPSQLANTFMNDCFSLLEYFKTSGMSLYDFSRDVDDKEKKNARTIYQIIMFLEDHMKTQGLRDYADQLLDTVSFFSGNDLSIPLFSHVLVDEYQDVNASQIELLELLKPNNVFFVGDPRQSIFGWRGSDIGHIFDFETKYPLADIIHLTKNYRSQSRIVSFMNHAIAEMGLPHLEGFRESGGDVSIFDFENELAERAFILNQIADSKMPLDDIFVLARTNRQLHELSLMMTQRRIPHVVKTDEVKNPSETKKGAVTLATIHAIKGLEARKVFVMGCTEQNFPCKANDHPIVEMVKMNNYDRLKEERRLFYVAISRAKEKLYITYSGKKPTYYLTDEMLELCKNAGEQEQIT